MYRTADGGADLLTQAPEVGGDHDRGVGEIVEQGSLAQARGFAHQCADIGRARVVRCTIKKCVECTVYGAGGATKGRDDEQDIRLDRCGAFELVSKASDECGPRATVHVTFIEKEGNVRPQLRAELAELVCREGQMEEGGQGDECRGGVGGTATKPSAHWHTLVQFVV